MPQRSQPEVNTIRVVLADDYPLVRQTIQIACSDNPRLQIVGQAGDGVKALDLCLELQPDVLVLDLMLPEMDGFEVAERLKQEGSPSKILILTARDDPQGLLRAMRLDVEGYLDKTIAMGNVAGEIEAVARGERRFSSEKQRAAMGEFGDFVRRARDTSQMTSRVTAREREILTMIAEGSTTTQMARRLGLSQRTIESHISNLYAKLGTKNRVQAVIRGRELGFIAED